jgi:SAM-dependent methyltransferase
LDGEGVDPVGDVHKLSQSFPLGHFDFVFSVSVFEHLLFPWKAVLEINKVLKTGGYIDDLTPSLIPVLNALFERGKSYASYLVAQENKNCEYQPGMAFGNIDELVNRDIEEIPAN